MVENPKLNDHVSDLLQDRIDRRNLLKTVALFGLTPPALASLLAACEDADDDEDIATIAEDDADDAEDELDAPTADDEIVDPEELDDLDSEEVVIDTDEIDDVPRERSLIIRYSLAGTETRFVDHEVFNPYALGGGINPGILFYEPLAVYSMLSDETYPWLAESWEFNEDSTQLTIITRSGIEWSDGEPFGAHDVAFTLNHLKEIRSDVAVGEEVAQFLDQAEATDENAVVVNFSVPAPRFFDYLEYSFGPTVRIVPQHIYEDQDWTTFTFFDPEQGWPLTTGPWRLVFSSPEQIIIDRRDSWWAVDQGLFDELPRVERMIYLPFADETGVAQQLVADQIDSSLDLRPLNIARVMEENPNIITHTYNEPPYGYVDAWPIALWVNHEESPFDEAEVRWAISYFIDRDQMIEVALEGSGSAAPLPLPTYAGLEPFFDSVEDILEEYNTLEFNPDRGQELLQDVGFELNGDGWWERDGQVLGFTLNGEPIFADIGPVIAEMLRINGIEAEYAQPPDIRDALIAGDFQVALHGHGGSYSNDPFYTMRLFATGVTANYARWSSEEYDAILDEMRVVSADTDQERLLELFRQAMEIWIPDLPNIQIQQWYHRVPMNTTYWEGWPTESDPYVQGASWHPTWQKVLARLEPTQ